MNPYEYYGILIAPHTTEKSVQLGEKHRKATFKVMKTATKTQIKKAVEKLFNVVVEKVSVNNVRGKSVNFKRHPGNRMGYKKATVSLAEGHDISFENFE